MQLLFSQKNMPIPSGAWNAKKKKKGDLWPVWMEGGRKGIGGE